MFAKFSYHIVFLKFIYYIRNISFNNKIIINCFSITLDIYHRYLLYMATVYTFYEKKIVIYRQRVVRKLQHTYG